MADEHDAAPLSAAEIAAMPGRIANLRRAIDGPTISGPTYGDWLVFLRKTARLLAALALRDAELAVMGELARDLAAKADASREIVAAVASNAVDSLPPNATPSLMDLAGYRTGWTCLDMEIVRRARALLASDARHDAPS